MNFYTIKQYWSEWSFAEYVYYLHADIMYVHVGCIKYYDLLYAFDDFA